MQTGDVEAKILDPDEENNEADSTGLTMTPSKVSLVSSGHNDTVQTVKHNVLLNLPVAVANSTQN